jgi:ABC-type glycerol-3-phosphate transport system substrate-binding protein
MTIPDGRVAYFDSHNSGGGENLLTLKSIEPDEEDSIVVTHLAVKGLQVNTFAGCDRFSIIVSDNENLYGLNFENNEAVKLLNWLDSGIDIYERSIESIIMLPDGRFICNTYFYETSQSAQKSELLILAKTTVSGLPEKTILTLATYIMYNDLQNRVMRFNRTNQDYFIDVIEYRDYDIVDGDKVGLTRLYTELISGKIPDILDITWIPYNQFAQRGLLVDLYPFIENDSEYDRNDLIESVFKTAEVDGKLYQLFPTFGISTMAGCPLTLGFETHWNLEGLKDVLYANPDAVIPFGVGYSSTKLYFLQHIIQHNIDEYLDRNNGTTNFNTDGFIAILDFINKSLPGKMDDIDWDGLGLTIDDAHGNLFAGGYQIIQIMQFNTFFEYLNLKAYLNGDIVFKGFPGIDSNGNSVMYTNGLAITSLSTNKDGAWQFVRSLLDVDFQLTRFYGFPTNKVAFNDLVNKWMDKDSGIIPVHPGTERPLYDPLIQEDVNKILELIDSLSVLTDWTFLEEPFWNIIFESAEDFFNGLISAEDAARIIQSRTSIYLSERS